MLNNSCDGLPPYHPEEPLPRRCRDQRRGTGHARSATEWFAAGADTAGQLVVLAEPRWLGGLTCFPPSGKVGDPPSRKSDSPAPCRDHTMSGRFKPPGQCPVCGEWVPRGAVACDECGACGKSGWSGETAADGLDLPDDEFDYEDFVAREFGNTPAKRTGVSPLWWWAALLLLIVFVLAGLMPLLR